jgi:hypothetical protein
MSKTGNVFLIAGVCAAVLSCSPSGVEKPTTPSRATTKGPTQTPSNQHSAQWTATVRGNSLEGLVPAGAEITFTPLSDAELPARGELVALRIGGRNAPVLKVVRGLPGDRFALRKVADSDRWALYVNDVELQTSTGAPFRFNERRMRMLQLYEKDSAGILPKDAILVLGNKAEGTLDATRFGLVGTTDVLGRAQVPDRP